MPADKDAVGAVPNTIPSNSDHTDRPFIKFLVINFFEKALNRGLFFSIGMFINRVIPERVFRFRVFDLFLLKSLEPKPDSEFQFHACETDSDFEMAKQVTKSAISNKLVEEGLVEAMFLKEQGKPVSGLWLANRKFFEPEFGIEIQLPEDSRWIFAAYTDTAYRRRGLYRTLMSQTMNYGEAANKRFFVCVNPCNRPSLIAHKKSAAQEMGRCYVMRIFGFGFCLPLGGPTVDRYFGTSVLKNPIKLFIESAE